MTSRTPADDFLKDSTAYKRFLRLFIAILAALVSLVLAATIAASDFNAWRLPGEVFLLGLLAICWQQLDLHPRRATVILVIGLWVGMAVPAVAFAGIHSANMMAFPFLIALTGWVLGKRFLIIVTVLTVVLMTILSISEVLGYYVPTPRAPPMMVLVINAGILIACSFLVHIAYTSFRESQQRAVEMSEQLGQHNLVLALREAEVHELNETLEQRVAERTAELARAMETLHHAQEELLQSEAKAALGAMVASVTHELNTPMGNSVMAASTLGDQAKAFLSSVEAGQLKRSELTAFLTALREGTDMIQRNLDRAGLLLKNFKQVAADQASEQRREFDLAHSVDEIVGMLRPQLKNSPHRIVLDIPEGIVMDSYPGPLGQVLINLINNAFLHAFEGLTEGVLTITAEAGAGSVIIRVSDNGIGMSHDTLTRLFQPFFSTKIGKGGTGLGMTIVEGIVRKTLGGSLHVESEPGHGTRFAISLPLAAPAF